MYLEKIQNGIKDILVDIKDRKPLLLLARGVG